MVLYLESFCISSFLQKSCIKSSNISHSETQVLHKLTISMSCILIVPQPWPIGIKTMAYAHSYENITKSEKS